jgi:putative DNA primase/helicase
MAEHGPIYSLARLTVAFNVLPEGLAALPEAPPGLGDGQVDPVFEWLQDHDRVLGSASRGWVPIACPWEDQHTPGPGAAKGTDYHPGAPGGFKCLHGHCEGRTTRDLKAWIVEQDPDASLAELEVLAGVDLQGIGASIAAALAEAERRSRENPEQRSDSEESVRFRRPPGSDAYEGSSIAIRLGEHINAVPLGPGLLPNPSLTAVGNIARAQPVTALNVAVVMEAIGLDARLNTMTWAAEATLAGWPDKVEVKLLVDLLVHACTRCCMAARDNQIWNAFQNYAAARCYHPVLDWIDSKPWDGVDRIKDLADTLVMRDPKLNPWRNVVVRRYLIQLATALTNWQREIPVDVGYCLVLQGAQGINKSKWAKYGVLPAQWVKGDMSLKLDSGNERDTIQRATMTAITELAELEATFRKSDISALKNVLTTTVDLYRPMWGRVPEPRARCTVFLPTINPDDYLVDSSGERRFWTLAVERCHWQHDIDKQQLMAQAMALMEQGEQYWLTKDEEKLHAKISRDHQADSDVNDVMVELEFYREGGERDDSWVHKSAKELLDNRTTPSRIGSSRRDLNARLARSGWAQKAKIRGKDGWWVPAKKMTLPSTMKSHNLQLVKPGTSKKDGD